MEGRPLVRESTVTELGRNRRKEKESTSALGVYEEERITSRSGRSIPTNQGNQWG
jgi:hypothetical protein